MSLQVWSEVLAVQKVDGAALSNTTAATSILHATAKPTLDPQYFVEGKRLGLYATGRASTVVTTPGTLTLDVRLKDTVPTTVIVANGGAMSLNVVAKTNVNWTLWWELTCRSIGAVAAATLIHQGEWRSHAVIGSPEPTAGGAGVHMLPYNAAPAVGTGFDSTLAQILDLFATWSVASASNSIQVHQFWLVTLN